MLVDNIFHNLNKISSDKLDRRSRLDNFKIDHFEMEMTKKIKKICDKENIPLNVFAISFLQDYLKIDKIILGSTKKKHLKEIYESKIQINKNVFDNVCKI